MLPENPVSIPGLVSRLHDGDERAFTALYEKYAKKVYGISRRMGINHEDAEGIVQEVFLRIWQNRSNLDSTLSFNAYIISILRSLVLKKARKEARFLAYKKYAIPLQKINTNTTEDEIIFEELSRFSSMAIEELPKGQKLIFTMKNFQHLTADEIAKQLKLSKRTVESQIYKATKNIKEKLLSRKVIPSDLLLILLVIYY